jgi:hypothetical protein
VESPVDSDHDGVIDAVESGQVAEHDLEIYVHMPEALASHYGIPLLSGGVIRIRIEQGRLYYERREGYPVPILPERAVADHTSRDFPFGLFALNIQVDPPGSEARVTITLPSDVTVPTTAEYQKYFSARGYFVYGEVEGLDDGDNEFVLILSDGGAGDADGQADGVIRDPGGIAIMAAVVAGGGGGGAGGCMVSCGSLSVIKVIVLLVILLCLLLCALVHSGARGVSRGGASRGHS